MKGTELANIEQKAGDIIEGQVEQQITAEDVNDLYFQMGGLDAIDAITTNLTSALIRTYQKIRDDKTFRAAGYERFDDFLDQHPKSRMSYKRFNYIEGIYKTLGPEPFELLSGSGLSMRQMKFIGKGNVEVENGRVIIHVGDQSEEIEISNRRQWLECVKALADANAEKTVKLTVQQERIDKHDDKVRELHAENDRIRAAKIADFAADAHMTARVELGLAFSKFTDIVSKLSDIEKNQFRNDVLEDIAGWSASLRNAYQCRNPNGSEGVSADGVSIEGDSLEEAFDNFLDTVDLDDAGNNDGELADQL